LEQAVEVTNKVWERTNQEMSTTIDQIGDEVTSQEISNSNVRDKVTNLQ
jgi:hypothetical protein